MAQTEKIKNGKLKKLLKKTFFSESNLRVTTDFLQ